MQDELLDTVYYVLLLSLLIYLSRHRWRRWFKIQKSRPRFVSSPEEDERSLRQQLSAPYLNGSQFHKTDHFFAVSALLREVLVHYEEQQIHLDGALFSREDTYNFTCLGTPLPEPLTATLAERLALRDDYQYTDSERMNRYCLTSPAGKPLNHQIGLWIDMMQSLLDTELVLLLEENNQQDRDCPVMHLSTEQIHHWLDEINDTMVQTASRVLQARTHGTFES
ncbi:hypothetical protein [Morganella psychrotolerans]|uniref:hypothetical protein n=1 Tax=Morganella psychrotolerans TaxID=368603 RepID=UPI0039AF21DC